MDGAGRVLEIDLISFFSAHISYKQLDLIYKHSFKVDVSLLSLFSPCVETRLWIETALDCFLPKKTPQNQSTAKMIQYFNLKSKKPD